MMCYRDKTYCMASSEKLSKQYGIKYCGNTTCWRHVSEIPDNLPDYLPIAMFYYYRPRGNYIDVRNFVGIFDIALYKSGNCFKREEDITDDIKEKLRAEYNEFFGE